jgi:hypothetical protein
MIFTFRKYPTTYFFLIGILCTKCHGIKFLLLFKSSHNSIRLGSKSYNRDLNLSTDTSVLLALFNDCKCSKIKKNRCFKTDTHRYTNRHWSKYRLSRYSLTRIRQFWSCICQLKLKCCKTRIEVHKIFFTIFCWRVKFIEIFVITKKQSILAFIVKFLCLSMYIIHFVTPKFYWYLHAKNPTLSKVKFPYFIDFIFQKYTYYLLVICSPETKSF